MTSPGSPALAAGEGEGVVGIDLTGKTGIVFGVANKRSLAWAIAQQLSAAGARLAFAYQGERLRESVNGLAESMPDSLVLECDVNSEFQIDSVFERVGSEFGGLDYLVHSIAFARKEDLEGALLDIPREGFDISLNVSAFSLLALARRAYPLMEGRNASILTLTFLASQRVFLNYNVMGTSKAALEQIVRQLAWELGQKAIRVNAISAGPVSTLSARGIARFTEMLERHRSRAPLRRNITTEEVGRAALFLLSDLASGVTGEVLHVDAGYNIMGL
jgi:enoyl-[acyl-carrier protein] reductase I